MHKKHHYVHVSKINAGMILSENLLDKLGHVLLPAGTELTESTIKSMAHHDEIHQLAIVSEDNNVDTENGDTESEMQQKKIERLGTIFRHAPLGEPSDTLKSYIEKYRRNDVP
jgi:hypothetical protein